MPTVDIETATQEVDRLLTEWDTSPFDAPSNEASDQEQLDYARYKEHKSLLVRAIREGRAVVDGEQFIFTEKYGERRTFKLKPFTGEGYMRIDSVKKDALMGQSFHLIAAFAGTTANVLKTTDDRDLKFIRAAFVLFFN